MEDLRLEIEPLKLGISSILEIAYAFSSTKVCSIGGIKRCTSHIILYNIDKGYQKCQYQKDAVIGGEFTRQTLHQSQRVADADIWPNQCRARGL